MAMTLRSEAFSNNRAIPRRYSGDGDDRSPPLFWSDPPQGTQELALIVDDPDAPQTEPWVHWILYKIPADLRSLPDGAGAMTSPNVVPGTEQGKNSWGTEGFRGPAPPRGHGAHHYHFRLFALDAPLAATHGLDKSHLMSAIHGHILDQAELVGTYQR